MIQGQYLMTIDLTGKRILVTGASRGIGKAIAKGMGASGGKVVIHYNKNAAPAEALAEEIGENAFCLPANLADPVQCAALFESAVDRLGGLDVLVNNAGISIYMPLDEPVEQWAKDWQEIMAVNLMSVELLSRLAVNQFKAQNQEAGTEQRGGRIINIASRAAFRGDTPEYMTYAASKAGMVALTKSIARAFGKDDVAAFLVAPGFTRTDMAQDFIDAFGEGLVLNDLALNRLTEPADIAPLIVFLASGLADHATGTSIDVNAGSYMH